jgi:3-oxoacyl-[acyl-carrier protein] reductase
MPIVADVASADGQKALFDACPNPDILINNNAGPPLRDFRELDRQKMIEGVTANMTVAIELIQRAVGSTTARRRIVNITSDSVESTDCRPRPFLRRPRGPDRVPRRRRPIGRRLQRHYQFRSARHIRHLAASHRREGMGAESGRQLRHGARRAYCHRAGAARGRTRRAWRRLCVSVLGQAGYIIGQNLLIDGGAFPGAF